MEKPWCGSLKRFLALPHVQEVRGCTCEPGGGVAVAGRMSLSICAGLAQQPLGCLCSWDALDDV